MELELKRPVGRPRVTESASVRVLIGTMDKLGVMAKAKGISRYRLISDILSEAAKEEVNGQK